MSAQPARVIPLPHRAQQSPAHATPLESFRLEDIPGQGAPRIQSVAAETLLAEALESLERDEPAEAVRTLAAILQSDPAHAEALLALGSIQHMQGDSVAAAESYRRAAAADPSGWQPVYNHSLLHEAAGERDEAVVLLHHAIALAPLEALPQCRLALLLESSGQLAEARVWWKRSVASDPTLTSSWLRLGLLELRLGRLADAVQPLERALGGDQEAFDAAYHLALAHIGLGAAAKASEALEMAVRLNPADGDSHVALASLALDSDDLEAAERHESAARALQPTPAALSLRLAQAWAGRGELALANEHYGRAVRSDSSLALGYFALTLEY